MARGRSSPAVASSTRRTGRRSSREPYVVRNAPAVNAELPPIHSSGGAASMTRTDAPLRPPPSAPPTTRRCRCRRRRRPSAQASTMAGSRARRCPRSRRPPSPRRRAGAWARRAQPIPGGVPVAMTSPGSSVNARAQTADQLGDAEDHVRGVAVLEDLVAVTRQPIASACGSGISSASRSRARSGRTCRATCRAPTGRRRTAGRGPTRR